MMPSALAWHSSSTTKQRVPRILAIAGAAYCYKQKPGPSVGIDGVCFVHPRLSPTTPPCSAFPVVVMVGCQVNGSPPGEAEGRTRGPPFSVSSFPAGFIPAHHFRQLSLCRFLIVKLAPSAKLKGLRSLRCTRSLFTRPSGQAA